MSTEKSMAASGQELLPRFRWAGIVGHLCALIVAGFFMYASFGKGISTAHVLQFSLEISNYQMPFMNPLYLNIPAILLPWIEMTAAIALLIPATRKAAAIVIGGMLLFFIYAVFDAAILRNLNIDCGCFGKNSGRAGWLTIGRNVLLLGATIATVYLTRIRASSNADELPTSAASATAI